MSFVPRLHTEAETHELVVIFITRAETWIAVRDSETLGLACIDGDWLAHLYVHPEHQNAGVGTALLDHVKKRRPRGFQFWTFQANAGARRFYERRGCALVRLADGSGNEEQLPAALYAWPAS